MSSALEGDDVPGVIEQEIGELPAAIEATLTEVRPAARRAADSIAVRRPRRIYLIGNGTSLYAALAASYTARALAGPDDPTIVVLPAGDFRTTGPPIAPEDVVVGLSSSGEFRDVVRAFTELRDRALLVAITQQPDSSLARLADLTLVGAGGPGRVPVMTRTFASTQVAAHLLLLELFDAPAEWFEGLHATGALAAAGVDLAAQLAPHLVAQLGGVEHAFSFGTGGGYAAALETALKLKEMALVHAEAAETSEMASGPATMVGQGHLAIALATGGPGDAETAVVARHARSWGARVLAVGAVTEAADWQLPVSCPRQESFASLVLVPPVVLLAYRLARARGWTPDEPAWRARYLAQGLTHIA